MSVRAVAAREWRALLLTPFGWGCLAVFEFIAAWLFLVQLDAYARALPRLAAAPTGPGVTDLVIAPLFAQGAILLLLVVPLVTMRLVSGERQAGTLNLLFSAPLGSARLVLGKFLGAWLFGLLLLALLALLPGALLLAGVVLDLGKLLAGLLGSLLLLTLLTAVGLLLSSYAAQPAGAAVGSFGLLLLLWVADFGDSGTGGGALGWLSLSAHFKPFLAGLVETGHVAYFLLLSAFCLLLAVRRVERLRDPV
ncbi:MAG TPA: ABC transporter permease subunit [Gammaproteobacteria bacterium]